MPNPTSKDINAKEQQLQKAIRAVQEGIDGGVTAAVEIYGVSRTTLYYRLSGKRQNRQAAHEDQQRLTTAEEKAIEIWCFDMDDRGFPPRLDYVKNMALHLEKKRIGSQPEPLGKNWITRFLGRHPKLAAKYSTQLERQRAQANNPRIMKDYFAKLARLIRRHGLKAFQIFNMDEKGFLMGMASRAKVLCRRGRRNPRVTHDGGRELVTVVETVCADGLVLSPLVINKGKGHYMGWYKNLTEKEVGYQFSYSPKGWVDNRLAMLWLTTIFEPETAKAAGKLPRLLILDGHGSHITYEFILYCEEHNILLLCLPSHSTHLLQPLDVGLFSPYQHFYGLAVDDYMRSGQNRDGIKKAIFIPFLTFAREKTFYRQSIQHAFEATGIWPLNPRRVLGKMAPEKVSHRDSLGAMTTPRSSRDIRRRVQVAEKLLDSTFASLSLHDRISTSQAPPTKSLKSPIAPSKQLLQVKKIMRDLGHQLETEIAHMELYQEQTRKLQGLELVYNKTDRRKLSEARILSGAALIKLRDQRLVKDAAKALKKATKGQLSKPQPKPRRPKKIPIPKVVEVVLVGSDSEDSGWDDVPIIGNESVILSLDCVDISDSQSAVASSPGYSSTRHLPDRPLHMSLRNRNPQH